VKYIPALGLLVVLYMILSVLADMFNSERLIPYATMVLVVGGVLSYCVGRLHRKR
jgi:formate hydrogenlyase subunit 3/multisubunit Na+/H+ antiporter MnhD subunit